MAYRDVGNQDEIVNDIVVSRVCKKCDNRKPFTEFHLCNDRKNRRHVCKVCCYLNRKQPNRENKWSSGLRRKYGITPEEFNKMWDSQNGKCNICLKDLTNDGISNSPNKVQIDHCHQTDRVRGLLCFTCNTALGKFQDSIELLKNAIVYLENPPEILYRDKSLSDLEKIDAFKNNAKKRLTNIEEVEIVRDGTVKWLTEEEREVIKSEYASGEYSQAYLAVRYGVSASTISNVVLNKNQPPYPKKVRKK